MECLFQSRKFALVCDKRFWQISLRQPLGETIRVFVRFRAEHKKQSMKEHERISAGCKQ